MSRSIALPRDDALDAFEAELLAGGIATLVLERWCGGRVHAAVVGSSTTATDAQRARLAVAADEPVRHRRVRLMHGAIALSEADNWYVPARLTPAMNASLACGDIPFGAVIAALSPTRRTMFAERLTSHDPILRVGALVIDADGQPLAEVVETYRRASLGRR